VSYRIRPFRKADFETLWSIDQLCFVPQLAYSRLELAFYMRRSGSFTLVAEGEDEAAANGQPRILGFIVAEIERRPKRGLKTGHIITIDVVPEARRGGIGSALLQATERQLHDLGVTSVALETAVNNAGALHFYKQQGYFVESTAPRYYSNQLDAFVMRKELVGLVASR
jgi:[ribosomal protein S18]-alanine N-acetyltransferase